MDESVGVFAGDEFVDRRALQGSRHNDALKLWLLWKCKGCRIFENQIDELMKLSRLSNNYLIKLILKILKKLVGNCLLSFKVIL